MIVESRTYVVPTVLAALSELCETSAVSTNSKGIQDLSKEEYKPGGLLLLIALVRIENLKERRTFH